MPDLTDTITGTITGVSPDHSVPAYPNQPHYKIEFTVPDLSGRLATYDLDRSFLDIKARLQVAGTPLQRPWSPFNPNTVLVLEGGQAYLPHFPHLRGYRLSPYGEGPALLWSRNAPVVFGQAYPVDPCPSGGYACYFGTFEAWLSATEGSFLPGVPFYPYATSGGASAFDTWYGAALEALALAGGGTYAFYCRGWNQTYREAYGINSVLIQPTEARFTLDWTNKPNPPPPPTPIAAYPHQCVADVHMNTVACAFTGLAFDNSGTGQRWLYLALNRQLLANEGSGSGSAGGWEVQNLWLIPADSPIGLCYLQDGTLFISYVRASDHVPVGRLNRRNGRSGEWGAEFALGTAGQPEWARIQSAGRAQGQVWIVRAENDGEGPFYLETLRNLTGSDWRRGVLIEDGVKSHQARGWQHQSEYVGFYRKNDSLWTRSSYHPGVDFTASAQTVAALTAGDTVAYPQGFAINEKGAWLGIASRAGGQTAYRSHDRGATWQTENLTLSQSLHLATLLPLAGGVFAYLCPVNSGSQVVHYLSHDDGKTWK